MQHISARYLPQSLNPQYSTMQELRDGAGRRRSGSNVRLKYTLCGIGQLECMVQTQHAASLQRRATKQPT